MLKVHYMLIRHDILKPPQNKQARGKRERRRRRKRESVKERGRKEGGTLVVTILVVWSGRLYFSVFCSIFAIQYVWKFSELI